MKLTKEKVLEAWRKNKRKKHWYIYQYYKDSIFQRMNPSEYIAESIQEDLGIPYTVSHVNNVFYRYKKIIDSPEHSRATTPPPSVNTQHDESVNKASGDTSKYTFTNASDLPDEPDDFMVQYKAREKYFADLEKQKKSDKEKGDQ